MLKEFRASYEKRWHNEPIAYEAQPAKVGDTRHKAEDR